MKAFPARKDSIILTAISIIDEIGFQGLSAQELARRESIAPSLIYRYYASMDDIVSAVVDYYSQYDAAIIRSVYMKSELSPREKTLDFLNSYVEYYENYPAVTVLVNGYESLKHDERIRRRMENIAENRIVALEGLLSHNQLERATDIGISSRELAITLWGYVMNLVLIWRMTGNSFPLKATALKHVENMLQVFGNIPEGGRGEDV